MDYFNIDSLPLLLPDESYACVFSVSKEIGAPVRCAGSAEIKWCSYMGEHGIVQGADVIVSGLTSQYNVSPVDTPGVNTPSGTQQSPIPILSPTSTSSVHTMHTPDNGNISNQGQHVSIGQLILCLLT